MSETILLDPEAITGGSRVEVSIATPGSQGPIEVRQDGVDWGDAEIQAHMADLGGVGSNVVDFDVPNRVISMKVKIQAWGDTTFAQARSTLQAKVALIQAEGGWISRDMPGVGTVYADLVNAKLNLPGDWMQAHRDIQIEATLSFEALPDFYEAEWVEVEFTDVEAGENHWRGVAENIRGDFPKGNRCKVVVEGDDDHDQRGLMAAFRCRHYSADPTAACFLQAQALDPLDLASVVTLTGASGGGSNNAVRHNNLGTGWTPVLGLQLAAGDYLTHTGTVRLIARVYTTSVTPPDLRAVFDVGDLVNPSENEPVQIPGASNFYLVDLGVLRLDRSPVGDHRWLGQIQARGAAGGENVYIDTVDLWPTDEYYAKIATPLRATSGLNDHVVRDEFNQGGGGLNGKTLPVGGTWAGAGDSDDFTINTTDDTARRTATSDAELYGRIALAGTAALGTVTVATDLAFASKLTGGDLYQGVVARYTNTSNFLWVAAQPGGANGAVVYVYKWVGGSATVLARLTAPDPTANTWYRLSLTVDDMGGWTVRFGSRGPVLPLLGQGADPVLATGGALASGKVGITDAVTSANACTRDYDNFAAWTPSLDAAVFADQAAELRTDGAYRDSADGVGSGVLVPYGNNPRLPQSGSEGRTTEVMVGTTRGDFDRLPDPGLDDVSVQLRHRPSWLTTPG